MTINLHQENPAGAVRTVTIGATQDQGGTRARTLTLGGETPLPFLDFEGTFPNPPALAIDTRDRKPDDWSPLLYQAWGEAMQDPADWARAAEGAGADLIYLGLAATKADGPPHAAAAAPAPRPPRLP